VNRHRAFLAEVIKMAKAKQKIVTGPRVLPVVQYGQTRYFADLRLRQFRDIENPHNYVDFDSEQGRLICRQTGVIWCPECGMSVIVSKASEQQSLRCMQCMSLIEPLPDR
jgi:hypothetical protein